jgi:hypothetical protein
MAAFQSSITVASAFVPSHFRRRRQFVLQRRLLSGYFIATFNLSRAQAGFAVSPLVDWNFIRVLVY